MRIKRIRVSPRAAEHMWTKHGAEPWEAVQVLDGGWPIQRARDAKGEKRYYAEGYTEEGRYLRVIFAVESVSPVTARIVTAYPAR